MMPEEKQKTDSGATEVLSFIIIFALIIAALVMWLLIAIPIYSENREITHNNNVLYEIADIKEQMDTLMLTDTVGLTRIKSVTLSPNGEAGVITILPDLSVIHSYGTVYIDHAGPPIPIDGEEYYLVKITYASSNMYATNVEYSYVGGDLYDNSGRNSQKILNAVSGPLGAYYAVVKNPDDFGSGGNERFVLQMRLDKMLHKGGNHYGVFTLSTGSAYHA